VKKPQIRPHPTIEGDSMRKTLFILVLMLSLVAMPAMAVTFTAVGTGHPGEFTALTGVDNSVLYLVTASGKLYSQAIATGALTLLATIPTEKLTAIVYPGATYTYIGTASGRIYRHTISGNAISKTTLAACTTIGAGIAGMKWDATLSKIWLITNKGKTYFCTP
jgi:hypothetical protein